MQIIHEWRVYDSRTGEASVSNVIFSNFEDALARCAELNESSATYRVEPSLRAVLDSDDN